MTNISLMENSYLIGKEPLELTKQVREALGEAKFKIAKQNSKRISAYKIVYKSQGHKVVGYIVEPKKGKKLPCIIHNRGGSNEFGAIKIGQLFTGLIAELVKSGYIVITTQYSGNGGSEGKDEFGGKDLFDVLELYKILKRHNRADISRIGVFGGSRGGMMAFLLLKKVKWIKALVVQAPSSDLFSAAASRPDMKKVFKNTFGGAKTEMKKRSVIFWVNKLYKKAPILLMHGTADWRVSVVDSLKLAEKFYENKIPFKMTIYEGDDHALTLNKKDSIKNAVQWFDRFVKNKEKLPDLKPHGL